MKPAILFLLLAGLMFSCKKDLCQQDIPITANTIFVLPLGDSRVEGARPGYESYRYELWKKLRQNDWDVNFIGSRIDNDDYPSLDGQCFDNEHEGTGGATTEDIINTLTNIEFEQVPDVVTLGIGGNDLLGAMDPNQAIANINQIIDQLQVLNPNVIILLERIAPAMQSFMTPDFQASFDQFNNQILGVATSQTNSLSKVYQVRMDTAWTDAYMADDVHYNEAGAKEVANRYYQAFVDYVN